jgi:hypothetical protein
VRASDKVAQLIFSGSFADKSSSIGVTKTQLSDFEVAQRVRATERAREKNGKISAISRAADERRAVDVLLHLFIILGCYEGSLRDSKIAAIASLLLTQQRHMLLGLVAEEALLNTTGTGYHNICMLRLGRLPFVASHIDLVLTRVLGLIVVHTHYCLSKETLSREQFFPPHTIAMNILFFLLSFFRSTGTDITARMTTMNG